MKTVKRLLKIGQSIKRIVVIIFSTSFRLIFSVARYINRGFKLCFNFLARVSALIYMLLYLLLIPLFAQKYLTINHEFYHSTIKSEPYFKETLIDFKVSLEADIDNILIKSRKYHQGKFFLNRSDYIDINDIDVKEGEIKVSGNYIDVTLFLPISDVNSGSAGVNYSRIKIFGGKQECNKFPGKALKRIQIIDERIDETFKKLELMITPPCDKYGKDALVTSKKTEQLFRNLTQASKGTPTDLEGNYARMLYLSATTLTALGGDISPITNRARRWVMIECILGIILMGLFLNSITTGGNHSKIPQEIQKPKSNTRKKSRKNSKP